MESSEQARLDATLTPLDGTENKGRLGANAILGRQSRRRERLGDRARDGRSEHSVYVGASTLRRADDERPQRRGPCRQQHRCSGVHGDARRRRKRAEAVRVGAEVFHSLGARLSEAGHSTNVGDEGGFAPALDGTDAALGHLMKAIEAAGYRPGEDVYLALDAAASEFYGDGAYRLAGEGRTLDAGGTIAYYEDLAGRYPIASIEDGLAEDDWAGWAALVHGGAGRARPAGRRRPVRHQRGAARARHRGRRGQRDPGQGQSGGDTHGNAGDGIARAPQRLRRRHVAPLGRDRGHHHRRSRGRNRMRADQGRRAVPHRPHAKYNQLIRIEEGLDDTARYAERQSDAQRLIARRRHPPPTHPDPLRPQGRTEGQKPRHRRTAYPPPTGT
ncbi:Enolase [Geodia barretti]|nr:Enolase [Geodia barretti]